LIIKYNLLRSPNIGLYLVATDDILLFPNIVPIEKLDSVVRCLRVKPIRFNLEGYLLNGALIACNSKGILLPNFTLDGDVDRLKHLTEGKLEVGVLPCKESALGNIILANDRGAIAYPDLPSEAIKIIRDVLDVEVERGRIAGLSIVGSLAVATNRRAIAHPGITNEERKLVESVLGIQVDVGTVNGGVPYLRGGMVANSNGAAVGVATTGPELMMIKSALDLT